MFILFHKCYITSSYAVNIYIDFSFQNAKVKTLFIFVGISQGVYCVLLRLTSVIKLEIALYRLFEHKLEIRNVLDLFKSLFYN